MDLTGWKKARNQPLGNHKPRIGAGGPLPLASQCALAGVAHSSAYAPPRRAEPDPEELALLGLIDAEYTRHPFYGSCKMLIYIGQVGHRVSRKRAQRLMRMPGLGGHGARPRHQPPRLSKFSIFNENESQKAGNAQLE